MSTTQAVLEWWTSVRLATADRVTRARNRWRAAQNDRARRNHKCLWRCYRDGGGGQLITPKAMTERRAVAWVAHVVNAEVFHVDFDHRMIFYRTRGNQQ
jgi:hypothetical protein